MKVRDVMTSPAVVVAPDMSYDEIARCLLAHHISGVPVVSDDGQLLGVVTEVDLAVRNTHAPSWVAKATAQTAAALMTAEVVTAELDEELDVVAKRMLACGINRLPVVRANRVVGIVSLHDLLHTVDWGDEASSGSVAAGSE